ncbi:D-sedoheptulose 7-phosphate isomerase [Inhella inkyongensis]|uniref:D-sedoheptulose 7-phosphate isomerase n=1 Tax=Inhella inkyongensis TaxID=392593 RepID=A0A840S8C5_9BURK|nr:SIS domain-containing protein [Inhella inkyongensis]MBB5204669.1 D-sedoheptulose 7-phosphate isomerase [Inhella inkyongensis]
MLEARIQQQFFESADLFYQAAEQLTRPLASAAQLAMLAVTNGGRLFLAGAGLAQLDAQWAAQLLMDRFEQDRPGLSALALAPQLGAQGGVPALARQLQSLGHPGDLLIWIDPQAEADASPLIEAAHGQDVAVVALCGAQDQSLRTLLRDTDLLIRVNHPRWPRVSETHRLALHALCDAIDAQLLGLEA